MYGTFNRVCRVGSAKGFRTLYNCTQYAPFVLLLYFLNSILMYSLCILDNSGTEGNSCKANSSTGGKSCKLDNYT